MSLFEARSGVNTRRGEASIDRRLFLAATGATAMGALIPKASAEPVTSAGGWGVDLSSLSRTARPGDAFFDYVNEGWLKTTISPPGYAEYGEINAMFLRTEAWLAPVIKGDGSGPSGGKLTDLYTSFMDTASIERAGIAPIHDDISAILAIKDHAGVARWMANPASHAIVGTYIFPDAVNTRRTLLHLDQQVLGPRLVGLPSRAHYEGQSGDYPTLRVAYRDHVAKMLGLAGAGGERQADAILALETRLAAAQWNAEQLRDRRLNYHPMSRADLLEYAPGFEWNAFLDASGFPGVTTVVLNTDTAVRACAVIFAGTSLEDWRAYLAFHWIQTTPTC